MDGVLTRRKCYDIILEKRRRYKYMIIVRDLENQVDNLSCGMDGSDGCGGDNSCSEVMCTGSATH